MCESGEKLVSKKRWSTESFLCYEDQWDRVQGSKKALVSSSMTCSCIYSTCIFMNMFQKHIEFKDHFLNASVSRQFKFPDTQSLEERDVLHSRARWSLGIGVCAKKMQFSQLEVFVSFFSSSFFLSKK